MSVVGGPHRPRNQPYRQCSERRFRITRWLCRLGRLFGGFITLLVLIGATSADASIPTGWSWVGTGPTVAVVGDSLTYQAEHGNAPDPYYQTHALTDGLNAAGYAPRVAARSGADTRSLRMWGNWQSPPDVIVMALGTNDRRYEPVLIGGTRFPLQLHISQPNVVNYLNLPINQGACVVFVGVVEASDRWRHDYWAPYWNGWLRQRAAATGSVFVDWWGEAKTHPEWFVADKLHHTAAGQAAYRDAIIEGVQRCP